MTKEDSGTVRSVIKALAALDFVVEESMIRPGVGLSEIAAALDIQPTTARNILKTMELVGYIDRAQGRLYVPGGKCFGMSRAAMIAGRLNLVMAPHLAELAREGGESLVLTTLFNGRRKVLLRNQGDSPVVVDIRNAEQERSGCELVTTRILLAYAAPAELELYLRRN
ncbi:MAG: helix-turn-helix domain-containing protein, partial [Victivallaceae bacterium]